MRSIAFFVAGVFMIVGADLAAGDAAMTFTVGLWMTLVALAPRRAP